ncbi:SusC/RagA family TonB-linked outer membrane protein [Labilibaculum antarcticum]|uniref:SusC/RagA family TonB-linked outer membrane protein n=1 Tax=Labilibaculum antarcticum TaxID=1717717 RepID=A0A1Y1CKX9_9BACT|nr:TonB-dependent receptor [Labilibaculum antarcticum]BAX81046.1 SusC/RagA family TonB-linked outer membrane protein [Labilibaculum antarcticum]
MKKSENFNAPTHSLKTGKQNSSRWLLKSSMLLLMVFCNVAIIFGQNPNAEITGKITDPTGFGIPGVNISLKGTTVGTVSDIDGNYSILASSENVIVYSFIGYTTQEILVADQTTINIVMLEDAIGMDEVVVVGYGVQKKSLVTGSISSIKSEDIQNVPVSRADQAIQGKTAGVSVLSTSGSPGAGTKIRIRGVNSNGNSNPLFIVDGMKTGDINNIDPGDIQSMEVLKDAASAAIYGTEGANGVILITTKGGKAGESKISYDFQYGFQSSRSDLEVMNASEYQQWMQESGAGTVTQNGTDTDWLDEIFEVAPMQKHHISFSGGSDKTTYSISGSYYGQDGIVGGDKAKYERFTARANVKSQLNDWLEVGDNLSFSHSKQKYIGEDDVYRGAVNSALLMDPLTPTTYDGTPSNVQSLLDEGRTILQNEDGKYYGLPEYITGETANPLALLDTYNNDIVQDKILGNVYATIKPIKGLTFTSRVGIDLTYQIDHSWAPTYYFSAESQNSQTYVDDNINKWYTWLWENFASYNTKFGDHDLTLLAGYSAEEYQAPDYSMHSAPLIKEGDQYAYQGYTTSDEFDKTGGGYVNHTMTSFFGRLSYNYLNRYMLEVSLRRDATDVFPVDNQAAVFSAVSAGWTISEEDFFDFKGIDYLKLRGSWGENGSRSNIPGNEGTEFYVFGLQYPGADDVYQAGAEIDKLVNPDLKWETTEQLDLGFDLRALNGKISFSMDYYNKKTKDLLTTGSGPLSAGNDFPIQNVGDVTNKGFDFELGYNNRDNKFKYSVNLNLSTLDNEVTRLDVDSPVKGDNLRGYDLTWFEEGLPIWYFKGYKTAGIDDTTGEVNVVDVNEDGEITDADQTYIGDPHADFLYGATFNAQYKGFDFNLFVQGSEGNDVFMGWFRSDRQFSNKPKFMFEDRWTPTNTSASRPAANNSSDYVYRSDLMVSDGSYIRIKQIQLGYTLPKTLVQKAGIDRARVFVSLDDFFTFTDYEGLDPEAGSTNNTRQGVDRGVYPIAGKVIFGVSVNF